MKNGKKILTITLLGFLLFSCNGKKVSNTSSSLNESSITSLDESTTTSIDSSTTSEDSSSSLDEENSSDNIVDGDKLQSDWNWD